jgi:hypothetical protein
MHTDTGAYNQIHLHLYDMGKAEVLSIAKKVCVHAARARACVCVCVRARARLPTENNILMQSQQNVTNYFSPLGVNTPTSWY